MAAMKLTTKVIEIDPDWLLVCFGGPKPEADKRAFWLHRTAREWLERHPGKAIRRVLPIQDGGELIGVHVWLGQSAESPQRQFPVKVHYRLADKLQHEHVEAFLHYAFEIFFQNRNMGSGALAVINRSGQAVVFDRAGEQSYLLPVEEMGNLDPRARTAIQQWQAQPTTNYFVLELAGFHPQEKE
jgi:hypothetical protein